MDTIIIKIPYWIIFSDQYVVDKLDLNPYLLNEWLRDSDELCSIEITEKTFRILSWLTNYLSRKYNKEND